jgi:hypothetical protein
MTGYTDIVHIIQIAECFRINAKPVSVSPLGSGHINDSYLVKTTPDGAPDYVLQRINHNIFRDVPGLMNNIEIVTSHLRKKLEEHDETDRFMALEVIPANDGTLFYFDPEGNYWRLYYYIPGSHSYDKVLSPQLAFGGGQAFGRFLQLTSDLDARLLTETIPRFHDITWRMEQFEEALRNDPVNRAKQLRQEINFLRKRQNEMHTIHRLVTSGQLHIRITHNDTKFNNILFDKEDRAICIVDLDTVMPGTILYDFGDAIRTGASNSDEDEADLNNVCIDMELFEAYTKGFLDAAGDYLTPVETAHLAFSARFMTFIIGLRFLTDHIGGDKYYKIHHPGHNLQRARTQFRLLESMENNFQEMDIRVTG